MTNAITDQLKADFLEWTGGFEPETVEQIEDYIQTSLAVFIEPQAARAALIEWMSLRFAVAKELGATNRITA